MPTRNVLLTDRQERMITELVGAGRYQNASEIIREGLRLVEEREAEIEGLAWLEHLGALKEQVERGEAATVPFEEAERHMISQLGKASVGWPPSR